MIKKLIIILIMLFIITSAAGCNGEHSPRAEIIGSNTANTTEDGALNGNPGKYGEDYSQLRDKYYCDLYHDSFTRQAWKLNIEDGSIFIACPDPLCGHGYEDEACPFRYVLTVDKADGGRYFFYIGLSKRKGEGYSIYCFDTETNTTEKIYTYDKLPSSTPLFKYGEGRLYFDIPQLKDTDGEITETLLRTVMYYDTETKKIEKFGVKPENYEILFAHNGKVYYRTGKGVYTTNGSFDDSEPAQILPDGGVLNSFGGYALYNQPGYSVKTFPPGDIYLYDEKRSVPLPKEAYDCYLVGLSATGDTFYFTLGRGETVNEDGGYYVVRVCILNKNGDYKIYTVQSNYSFYVLKGYGDRVVCSVESEYRDGVERTPGTEEENTQINLMLIDLPSGNASLYSMLPFNASDLYLNDITVKTERIK